jgi:hypothetical protein
MRLTQSLLPRRTNSASLEFGKARKIRAIYWIRLSEECQKPDREGGLTCSRGRLIFLVDAKRALPYGRASDTSGLERLLVLFSAAILNELNDKENCCGHQK